MPSQDVIYRFMAADAGAVAALAGLSQFARVAAVATEGLTEAFWRDAQRLAADAARAAWVSQQLRLQAMPMVEAAVRAREAAGRLLSIADQGEM